MSATPNIRRLLRQGAQQLIADAKQIRRRRAPEPLPHPPPRDLHIAKGRWHADNPHIPWDDAPEGQKLLYLLRAAQPTLAEELTAGRL